MLLIAETQPEVADALGRLLADVESRFGAELLSDLPCVNQLAEHVERYRGKMLRPTLVLLSAMACTGRSDLGELSESAVVAATVCEMVHMATLVHDDILDGAEMRRQGATVNQLRGNETAVMLGDYLISHAYHFCSDLGRADISRAIARATNTVCEGELLQLANRENWALDEQTYYEIIRRKTASLVGLCCELPVRLSSEAGQCGGSPGIGEALFTFGEKLGVAFQIIDDLLDLTGDEHTVGKSLGRDLAKGKLTLPVIRYLAQADTGDAETMLGLLRAGAGDHDLESPAYPRVCEVLAASGMIQQARDQAEQLVQQARDILTQRLPDSPGRATLLAMADQVVVRRY